MRSFDGESAVVPGHDGEQEVMETKGLGGAEKDLYFLKADT